MILSVVKRSAVVLLIVFGFTRAASAQVNPHAIGLRLGGGYFSGIEISYQQGLSGVNRFELDLGLAGSDYYGAFKLSGNYQWVHPTHWTPNLNWFIGPGAYIGGRSYHNDFHGDHHGDLFIGANGQIGLEYDFDFPLQLSIDFRPQLGLIGGVGFYYDTALGIRYYW